MTPLKYPVTRDDIFRLLATAECGAYVMSHDQTILYWNEGAQRILGYPSTQVVGRRCYEVVTGLVPGGFTPDCQEGCPAIRAVRVGTVPSSLNMRMLCASGEHKTVSITPMVVAGTKDDPPLLVYLFDESPTPAGVTAKAGADPRKHGKTFASDRVIASGSEDAPRLTPREAEILRLVSEGWEIQLIADELGISLHTVRNHIRNLRQRLHAKTKLEAVMTALRLGLL